MVVEEAGMIYKTTSEIKGPILMVEGIRGVSYDEVVRIRRPTGEEVTGSVLDVSKDWAMVQCFGDTSGMDLNVQIRFTGETLKVPMSPELIGRVFSGSFQPLDGMPVPLSTDLRDVNGGTINPAARNADAHIGKRWRVKKLGDPFSLPAGPDTAPALPGLHP